MPEAFALPHVSMIAMSGLRVREAELAALGMSLPGLRLRAAAIESLPPLGLLTLAGMTPDNWTVSLHEAPAAGDDLIQRIMAERPTLVAISALTASILEAYALSDALRAQGVQTVLGGLHVTACPDEAQQHATAIVIGDGEPVWPDVLRNAEAGALAGRYRATAQFDLARAPMPRYNLLGPARRPRYTLQTSRGCPFACDFCGASRLLGPYRRKPAERVRAELAAICAVGGEPRPAIELADDNTFATGGPHEDLLAALADSGARWFTEADWRLGENPAVLERLAAAGCVQVLIGLESLAHAHPGMGAKRASLARMLEAVQAIQAAGVAVIGCFIAGSDGEDEASLARLGALLDEDPCADVQLTLQTPFPGTALRRRLASEGRLLADKDWSHCTLFDVTYQPDRMTPEALQAAFGELVQSAFRPAQAQRRSRIRHEVWSRNPMLN